jgi:CDP-ribitol ribitolphosphotransferase
MRRLADRLIVALRAAAVRAGFAFGRLLPLQRRAVLATANASEIGGNLAFIRDEMIRRQPPIPHRVLVHPTARGVLGRARALLDAALAGYHLARARAFVTDTYYFPIYAIRPRRGTTIVQTWHASGAFKKVGYSVLDKSFGATEELTGQVRIHANYDICLIGSRNAIPAYAEAFGQPSGRFVTSLGIPRTDLFFARDAADRADALRRRYGLTDGRRVILYAPTFRGDSVTDARDGVTLDLPLLARDLAADHILLLKLHPYVRSRVRIGPEIASFVVDASDHSDINELMLVSDLLLTDYSSAIFEFALLRRPILFYAPDHAAYERERGFYLDLQHDLPGPIFERTDALAAFIREGAFDLERVDRFARASFDVADGHASERFVDRILVPALAGRRPAGMASAADIGDAPTESQHSQEAS